MDQIGQSLLLTRCCRVEKVFAVVAGRYSHLRYGRSVWTSSHRACSSFQSIWRHVCRVSFSNTSKTATTIKYGDRASSQKRERRSPNSQNSIRHDKKKHESAKAMAKYHDKTLYYAEVWSFPKSPQVHPPQKKGAHSRATEGPPQAMIDHHYSYHDCNTAHTAHPQWNRRYLLPQFSRSGTQAKSYQ